MVGCLRVVSDADAFAGKRVVVIGNGPSLQFCDPATTLKGRRFIACNSGCRWARAHATADDILYFTDAGWSERFASLLEDWPGRRITSNRRVKAALGDLVTWIDIIALTAWTCAPPDAVQASSGHAAAALAAWMGAESVELVGMDCADRDGRSHWHDDYRSNDASIYADRFLPGWRALIPALAARGCEVWQGEPAMGHAHVA